MQNNLEQLKSEALAAIEVAKSISELDGLENKLLGRAQGELTKLMKGLKEMLPEERKAAGESLNKIKDALAAALVQKRKILENITWEAAAEAESIDVTEPALPQTARGHFHPTTIIQRDLEQLFGTLGFMLLDGPELESDYYNFGALNFPPNHPARDMQDSFYIKGHPNWLMRTHTSPMQVRALQKYGAPIRAVVPGKCYRNEATDVRHEHTLYQMEGFVVDRSTNFGDMKGVLEIVAKHLYGQETEVRMRPKYYPFVEPGVNGEVTCFLCKGKGCRVCKNSGWLEIFGAGMIHPNVLKEGGVDHKKYQGFAFGFGLSRLVMLKYGITDIRLLESGDLRFLEQF